VRQNYFCRIFSLTLISCALKFAEVRGQSASTSSELEGWTLDEKIGQLFLVGYRSAAQMEKVKPGGVVLFSWSLKDVDSARDLIQKLKNLDFLKAPLFIATDHEGGRVLRLRKGLTPFPDAHSVGATENTEYARQVGRFMGIELGALGFNMNLAPVLDIGNGKSFLENRIWGSDPEKVAQMTTAFIQGLSSEGVIPVAKHFPGHGGTAVDSHFDLPVITKSWADYWKTDLLPFRRAVTAGLDAMMSAHVQVPAVSDEPASISQKFITQVLREQLGFKGLIITDDLEMGGLSQRLGQSVEDLALRSIVSGTDMVMVVWSWDIQEKIFSRIKEAILQKQVPEELLDQRVQHILSIKKKWIVNNEGPKDATKISDGKNWKEKLRTEEALKLVKEIRRDAIKWYTPNKDQTVANLRKLRDREWIVLVSSEGVKRFWNRIRPRDSVLLIKRRPDTASLKRITQTIENGVIQKVPVIVVTQPTATLGAENLSQVMRTIGGAERNQQISTPVVWLHQGALPVTVKNGQDLRTALVALHSTSVESIRIFYESVMEKYGSEF
jgi:beta-glucosidase-like glycosyl hydrolase